MPALLPNEFGSRLSDLPCKDTSDKSPPMLILGRQSVMGSKFLNFPCMDASERRPPMLILL